MYKPQTPRRQESDGWVFLYSLHRVGRPDHLGDVLGQFKKGLPASSQASGCSFLLTAVLRTFGAGLRMRSCFFIRMCHLLPSLIGDLYVSSSAEMRDPETEVLVT